MLQGIDKKASMTAFVTLALNNSLELLEEEDQRATVGSFMQNGHAGIFFKDI